MKKVRHYPSFIYVFLAAASSSGTRRDWPLHGRTFAIRILWNGRHEVVKPSIDRALDVFGRIVALHGDAVLDRRKPMESSASFVEAFRKFNENISTLAVQVGSILNKPNVRLPDSQELTQLPFPFANATFLSDSGISELFPALSLPRDVYITDRRFLTSCTKGLLLFQPLGILNINFGLQRQRCRFDGCFLPSSCTTWN
jgi:hypothetical protein